MGIKAHPIAEVDNVLGIGKTTRCELVKSGELETFTIGARRYVTDESLRKFIKRRVAAAAEEDRAAKSAAATEARQRKRQEKAGVGA